MGVSRRLALVVTGVLALALGCLGGGPAAALPQAADAGPTVTAVPRPDHAVVLVLENHSSSNILGNPAAPYLNGLAASGASMTQSYAVTHPSQPNYIALLSGSPNGVTDDSCPHTFATDNLAAQLIGAGAGFVGYSEDLPSVGYQGCTSGAYARKHNPWVNFSNVPASANQPLTAFPTDYATLPAVSFVIPNLVNDMHDGTIGQGDTWVRDHLDGYVQWAKQHNSVLVLTFDEDDNTAGNQIPTIVVGQRVQPGQYSERITHYDVLRTLQDAFGLPPLGASATARPILDIWTVPADAPRPAFTLSCTDLTCVADGSASTAPGGTISRWSWDWGDGTVTADPTTSSHRYSSTGAFSVTLTVTDDRQASTQVSHPATPRAPGAGDVFAADAFNRTVSAGLGTADVGGAWTLLGGAANFSVAPGTASLVLQRPGSQLSAYLGSVSSTDTDLRLGLAATPLPNSNGLYLTVVGRRVGTNAEYEGRVRIRGDGSVVVSLAALAGSSTLVNLRNEVVAPGLSAAAGATLRTRLVVTGTNPTTVKLKVWSGSTEPADWLLSATDGTPVLQARGGIGLTAYLSSGSTTAPVTARISGLSAGSSVSAPVNQPPVARFTASPTGLAVSADATASSDPDGTVASYAWDFGDGTAAGSGSRPSHTYAASGTYPVRLVVTDDRGATGTVSHDVTVTSPPTTTLASDDFARTSASGWGSADTGGPWTSSSSASNFSVTSGTGRILLRTAGSGPSVFLDQVSSTDVDLQARVSSDKAASGSGTYVSAVGRRVAGAGSYLMKVRLMSGGAVRASVSFVSAANAETVVVPETVVSGLSVAAGDVLALRFQATGTPSTVLRGKVWPVGTNEPSGWTVSGTDARAAMQAPGGVGFVTYLSSTATTTPVTLAMSRVRVVKASTMP
jgi:PKD repeat protein